MTSAGCRPAASDESAVFWNGTQPFSADPIDADEIVHSIAFGPVQATLVDKGRKGSLLGGLAESWTADADFKRWDFVLREGLRYETGEPVRGCDVTASWERLRALMLRRGSKNPVFDALAQDRGLSCDERTVSLRLRIPIKNLPLHLSDEIYALAHPSCYAKAGGAWLCGRKPIASGPYRLSRWDGSGIELALRDDFPTDRRHPRAYRRIRVVSDSASRRSADLLYSLSKEVDVPPGLRFYGGMDSAIGYARCQSWSKAGTPCGDRASRRRLRDAYYRELAKLGRAPSGSFFPLSIAGIRPPSPAEPEPGGARLGTVFVRPFKGQRSFLSVSNVALQAAIESLGGTYVAKETSNEQRYKELTPGLPRYENDIVHFLTEVTLDDPRSSVRFMFTSKEGARLPDPTGRIASELRRADFDLQEVNQFLHDDAIIWPFVHAGFGVWAGDSTDVSLANTGSVIVPLAWLGAAR